VIIYTELMTSLKYMRQFARSYAKFPISQVQLDQMSWYRNITLLKNEQKRFRYADAALMSQSIAVAPARNPKIETKYPVQMLFLQ